MALENFVDLRILPPPAVLKQAFNRITGEPLPIRQAALTPELLLANFPDILVEDYEIREIDPDTEPIPARTLTQEQLSSKASKEAEAELKDLAWKWFRHQIEDEGKKTLSEQEYLELIVYAKALAAVANPKISEATELPEKPVSLEGGK